MQYMETARAVPAVVPQKWPKLVNCPPPRNHQNGTFSVGRVGSEPATTMVHGHVRERNAKQNAPRAIGRSNWRSVVRFVSRFSRARVRTASVPARPHVQTGPRQWGYPPTPLLSNLAPGATFGAAAVPRGLTSRELTVPSKGCRPQKKIHSDTLLCSIFATTLLFGQKIFLVQKWTVWGQLARCQRLCPRNDQNWGNWGNAPPPRTTKITLFRSVARPRSPRQR